MSENVIKIGGIDKMQCYEFDFDENCFRTISKGILNGEAGIDTVRVVPFSDITGIELAKPGLLTVGQITFILKGVRYVNRPGIFTFILNSPSKDRYSVLEDIANRIQKHLGNVEIKKKNGFNVPEKTYSGEYDIDKVVDKSLDPTAETRKRCNVCGHIFCYNNADIKKNRSNARSAVLSSIGGIAGAVGGAYTASAVNNSNAQNSLDKIVDFNRCPKCNSTNLSVISDEEFEKMKAQNQQVQQPATATISAADELKKFKELLDMGAITQEEFDAKKKELLGL